ncbi:MAG: hypothetical protein IT437_00585 [Phycisphaerales bacterium]|nr:hypothetical protein [Phycisphaerales bacterium]
MKKKLLITAGVLAGLLVVLVLAAGFAAGMFARQGIQSGASYALGVPTTVDSASLGIFGGRLALAGVTVDNPPGYTTPHVLHLGRGAVAVTLSSLLKDTIEVPEFTLADLDLNLERRAGKANYQVIMDNLEKVIGPAPPQPPPDQKKFIVDTLSITNVTVHVDVLAEAPSVVGEALGGHTKVDITIPEIKLSGVGRTGTGVGGTGVTTSQLAGVIYEALMAAVVEHGGDKLPADILGDLRGQLGDLRGLANVGLQVGGKAIDTARNLGEQAKKAGGEIKSTVESEAEKIKKGIGDVFGGDKKKGGG